MSTSRLKRSSSRTVEIEAAPPSAPTHVLEEKHEALCELITQHENGIAMHAQALASISKQEKYKALPIINEQMLIITEMNKLQQGAKKHWQDNTKKKLTNERILAHEDYLAHLGHYLQQITVASISIKAIVNSYYLLDEVFPILEQQQADIKIVMGLAAAAKQLHKDDDIILQAIATIESLEKRFEDAIAQSQKDKNVLFAQKDIEFTTKIENMRAYDQALATQLKEIYQQILLERLTIENRIALIKTIEDEADAMLNDMRKEAAIYQSAYPGMQTAAGVKSFTSLSALGRVKLSVISDSLKEDAAILSLPSVTEQRLALYKREKTHSLDELKAARTRMQDTFKARAIELSSAFQQRINFISDAVKKTQANLNDDTKHLASECQRLIQALESYPATDDAKISMAMWQTVSQLNMDYDLICQQLEFYDLKNQIILWHDEIVKMAFDKVFQDDYKKILHGMNLRILQKNFSDIELFRQGFVERRADHQALIDAARTERQQHTASTQTLIDLLQQEKNTLRAAGVPDADPRNELLQNVIKQLNDTKDKYLTRVLGGLGKDTQEKQFYQSVQQIIEDEFVTKKSLRILTDFSDRNIFVRWFCQLVNKIHRALPDKLKSKATRAQQYSVSFFASKHEIAVANILEKTSNAITTASNSIASRGA